VLFHENDQRGCNPERPPAGPDNIHVTLTGTLAVLVINHIERKPVEN
jgi:hypothetical protein